MMLKKILFSLFIIVVIQFGFSIEKVTVYGDAGYPPYSFEDNGKPAGIYVEILEQIFSRMPDYDITIELIPWKRGILSIQDGYGFALFPPYYGVERTEWMDYSEPILEEFVTVFGKAENLEGKETWPESFYGSRVGLNSGYSPYTMGGNAFGEACDKGDIILEDAKTTDQNLQKLVLGRIDYYIIERFVDISAYPSIKRGMIVNQNSGYLGFTKNNIRFPFIEDFKEQFNSILMEIKASDEIDRIMRKYELDSND